MSRIGVQENVQLVGLNKSKHHNLPLFVWAGLERWKVANGESIAQVQEGTPN